MDTPDWMKCYTIFKHNSKQSTVHVKFTTRQSLQSPDAVWRCYLLTAPLPPDHLQQARWLGGSVVMKKTSMTLTLILLTMITLTLASTLTDMEFVTSVTSSAGVNEIYIYTVSRVILNNLRILFVKNIWQIPRLDIGIEEDENDERTIPENVINTEEHLKI